MDKKMIINFIKNLLIKFGKMLSIIKINAKTPSDIYAPIHKISPINRFQNEEFEESYKYFKKFLYQSALFKNVDQMREHSINTALENDKNNNYFYLEFGVNKGDSINFFSKYIKKNKIYGFDSFEGLSEDWKGVANFPKKTFDNSKNLPKCSDNVILIKGKVENTLENFIEENKSNLKINFAHIDVDTYSPSKFVLEKIKPYLVKNSIILFDELHNHSGWSVGEFKALKEVFNENEYEYISFSDTTQASIKIL
tara:strand:- start:4663 stop:5421 length:759 start_codon:yes stop_codon:yes gene_type:complete